MSSKYRPLSDHKCKSGISLKGDRRSSVVLAFSEWNATLQVLNDLLSRSNRAWAGMGWDRKSPDKQLTGCSCTCCCTVQRGESCSLENYVSTNNWPCPCIRGRCSTYVVLSEVEKHVRYGEFVVTTECLTLYPRCRTNWGRYNRVQLYMKGINALCDQMHSFVMLQQIVYTVTTVLYEVTMRGLVLFIC
jgi:hypothetical protein